MLLDSPTVTEYYKAAVNPASRQHRGNRPESQWVRTRALGPIGHIGRVIEGMGIEGPRIGPEGLFPARFIDSLFEVTTCPHEEQHGD